MKRSPIHRMDRALPRMLPLVLLGIILNTSCKSDPGEYYRITGFTQGTSYHITYQHPSEYDLKPQIDTLLRLFDLSLSAYEPKSIISRVNANDAEVQTDMLFRTVFKEAERIHEITGGAFDITLGPVINAWGFGPENRVVVDSAIIDSLMVLVGMEKVALDGEGVHKEDPRVQLNVNAIAQGYAVDYIAAFLDEIGSQNYMVEIGGEIRTRGKNPKDVFWRIGIDRPLEGNMIPGQQLQAVVSMQNRSLATSGNYRKFYEAEDGRRVTHSIDPSTGYPRESALLSATILCDECMRADALATSCMVLGLQGAKELVRSLEGTDAYLIYSDSLGAYQHWSTAGLDKYLEE